MRNIFIRKQIENQNVCRSDLNPSKILKIICWIVESSVVGALTAVAYILSRKGFSSHMEFVFGKESFVNDVCVLAKMRLTQAKNISSVFYL